MATPVNTMGASRINPNLALSPAESEVTNINPSAVVASGADAAPTANPSPEPASVSEGCQTYQSESAPAVDRLESVLVVPTPSGAIHLAKVGANRLHVIPMLSTLLRKYPSLSGDATPDDIDADLADADACTLVLGDLAALTARVTYTRRIKIDSAWSRSSVVYATAVKKAGKDSDIARDVAPIQAFLATGPRADKSQITAVIATQTANKATAKAGTLQQKATAKTAAATALQHGTGDAVITQPAPSAPASTTPPSAPASGSTPGTPGSTPIR